MFALLAAVVLEAVHHLVHEHTLDFVLRARRGLLDIIEREMDLFVYVRPERVRDAFHRSQHELDLLYTVELINVGVHSRVVWITFNLLTGNSLWSVQPAIHGNDCLSESFIRVCCLEE